MKEQTRDYPFRAGLVADFGFDLATTDTQGIREFKNLFNGLVEVGQEKMVRVQRWQHPAGEEGNWSQVGEDYTGNQVELTKDENNLVLILQGDGSVTRIPLGKTDEESFFQSYGNNGLGIGWDGGDGSRMGLTFVPESFAPETRPPVPEPPSAE